MDVILALSLIVNPGLELLPEYFRTDEARVMLLAIGLQESQFKYRKQIRGKARSFYQFERRGGIDEVLRHPDTEFLAKGVLYKVNVTAPNAFDAVAYNDPLATAMARLLLETHNKPLPTIEMGPDAAWRYYTQTWRPGKLRRSSWKPNWDRAVRAVRVMKESKHEK